MARLSSLRRALALDGLLSSRLGVRPVLAGNLLASAAIVGVATTSRLVLGDMIAGAQFITFFPAVMVATLFFGTAAGITALVLSTAAAKVVMDAQGLTAAEWASLMMFMAVAALDVAIISALLSANAALRRSFGQVALLNAHLSTSEAKFRDLLETAPDAIVIVDRNDRITLVNAEATRLFGFSRDELVGHSVEKLMPAEHRAYHKGKVDAFIAAPGNRHMGAGRGLLGLRKDGTTFPIETNLSLLTTPDGPEVCSIIRDIRERRAAEQRQILMIHELNHRVKNTLATVQAITAQTLKSATDPAAFKTAMMARLMALAQSHDLLTRNDWRGARLRDLIAEQMRPYETGSPRRFRVHGPDLMLPPKTALPLGMALSELATNAAKHGALSVREGEVEIAWEVQPGPPATLKLVWRESAGPPVSPPVNNGFGSRLIQQGLPHELGGQAQMEFRREGLICEISFPLPDGAWPPT